MPSSPIPLDIPPGILLTTSSKGALGRYIDADHIRFRNKKPEKIGGWTKKLNSAVDGLIRGMFGWTSDRGTDLVAGGTHSKFYSISDELQDITPLRSSGTLGTDPFAVVDTETTVTVTHTAHGLDVGAYVSFDGASAGGGITIDGEYQVLTVPDADSYTIEHSAAATSTDATTGGSSVDFEYQINPGKAETVLGLGWGAGGWGEGTWGTPRSITSGIAAELRYWSIVTFGNQLAIHPSGGTVYLWDEPNADARAAAVSNAPSAARSMFITPERMIVMLGTTNPMKMEWCDRDDTTDWTPSVSNTANARTLQSGTKLIAGTVFDTVSLIWSDTSVYLMDFIEGSDFIYRTEVIGRNCGLIAPGAFAVTPIGVVWMSAHDFHIYAGGSVSSVPRTEEIRDFIFGNATTGITGSVNRDKTAKTWADFNIKFREVEFGYVSVDSTDGEPDRTITVSLEDWSWWPGTKTRTAMCHSETPAGDIAMAGTDSYVYLHDVGKDAEGAALEAYVESGIMALAGGAGDMDIEGLEPDFERQSGTVDLTLWTKDRPQSTSELERETFEIAETDDLVDIRMGGRYAGFRFSSNEVGGDFRVGQPAIEAGPAGGARR
ncbi:hypothetical protein [Bauldia litoralis]|uniref:hypothetical protein n=1 Tax=Bauldia litoralis TaxID=665467 RepID=UPI003267ACF7